MTYKDTSLHLEFNLYVRIKQLLVWLTRLSVLYLLINNSMHLTEIFQG